MGQNNIQKLLFFITKSNFGGAQRYVFDLVTNLPKDLFHTKVALGGNGILKEKLLEKNIHVIDINALEKNVNVFKDIKVFFELIRIIKREKPDIIHLNSSKVGALGSLAGRICGVKRIIFTAHGWAFNENRPFLAKLLIKSIYLATFWFCHSIISVSNETSSQISHFPFNKKKIQIIYNGIDDIDFKNKEEARQVILNKLSKSNDEVNNQYWIGSIGELHPIKGHTYAIEAIGKLIKEKPSLKMKYFILGSGEIKHRLQNKINDLGLNNNVFLTGFIENVANVLKAFDLFLFPSLSEGLPYALLESGKAGLVSIASDVGGIKEIIENNKNGLLFSPKNPEEIKDSIIRILDNKNNSEAFGISLKNKIDTNFSLSRMVNETVCLYSKK